MLAVRFYSWVGVKRRSVNTETKLYSAVALRSCHLSLVQNPASQIGVFYLGIVFLNKCNYVFIVHSVRKATSQGPAGRKKSESTWEYVAIQ